MKTKYFSILGIAALATAFTPLALPPAAHALSTDVQPKEEDMQILTRGPVHEAFAEVVMEKPEPGFIVTKAPPGAIEELPPEKQLEGDNVTWISGYWAWDDDRSDFLWVSGVWRNIPPGRQWVPGYWNDLSDGRWQWTSGYWSNSELTEVDYVDEAPPETLDSGPNIAAPDDESTWVPGNWRYVETRYVWSPGYWTPQRPDWNWVPSRWAWTPHGYCYNDGYWDYAVANRGVLFAPAYFSSPVWTYPNYYYTPSVVVGLGVFDNHCWIRPRFGHYYFGDYYGARYSDLGFFVSYNWHGRRGCYDPIWAYNSWHHRHDGGWANRVRDRYAFFRDNVDARPFRTWAAMRDFRRDRFSDNEFARSRLFASTLDGYANNPVRGERFRQLTRENRDQLVAQRQRVRDFTQQRRQLETARTRANVTGAGARANRMALQRERLSGSPVMGRQLNQIARNQAPPQRPLAARGAGRVRPDAVVGPNSNNIARNRSALAARPNNAVQRTRDALAGRIPGTGAKRLNPQVNRDIAGNATRNRLSQQANRNGVRPGAQNQNATPRRTPQIGAQRQTQRQSVQPSSPQRNRQQALPQQRQAQRQSVQPQRRPQVTPQQRPQARPQQRQAPQRQNVQPQRRPQQAAPQQRQIQRQQVRPQQRVAPQRQQARPQIQSRPQPRQQVRPQARQSVQRPQMQSQRSRPSVSQSRPQARPQTRQASPQTRSSGQRSTTQQKSGRNRNN